MKLKILWKQLSHGQLRKVFCVTRTCVVFVLTFMMLPFIPMLFIEEVVKSFQLPEESFMHVNLLLNLVFRNQFSFVRFNAQMIVSELFIRLLLKEEVLLFQKNLSMVLL
jgi:hypothetical protein